MPQRMIKFAVEVREIRVRGLGVGRESAEDPIDGFPERPRAPKHPRRPKRSPSGLTLKGTHLRSREDAALACPLEQIPVPVEPLDRLRTPAPTHRVGEIEA
jgi:hypothetical protein